MAMMLLLGPAVEPVGLADLKAWLRIDADDEDGLITALITSARLSLETATGKAFITQSWRLVLDQWPGPPVVNVPLAPLQSLTAARIYNADGTTSALNIDDFLIETAALQTPRITLFKRQPPPLRPVSGIELDVVAGYGSDGSMVPATLILALKLLVAFWFENRGDEPSGIPLRWPDEISRLVAPFQTRRV